MDLLEFLLGKENSEINRDSIEVRCQFMEHVTVLTKDLVEREVTSRLPVPKDFESISAVVEANYAKMKEIGDIIYLCGCTYEPGHDIELICSTM